MYRIYIKNYNGALSPSEEALFDSSNVQNSESDRTVLNPVVKNELNKAGSFEFTVLPTNTYYDKIKIVKTIFSVYLDDIMIFRGRVMTISDDIFKQRNVFCEGELAYLNDSLQPPVKESKQDIASYLLGVVNDHNLQMRMFPNLTEPNEDDKCFIVGDVSVSDGRLSYLVTSNTGEVITEDENSNFGRIGHSASFGGGTVSVKLDADSSFHWEQSSIDTDDGSEAYNPLVIRSKNALYVQSGSVITVRSGFEGGVFKYSDYSSPTKFNYMAYSGPLTDLYIIDEDCYIRVTIRRVPEDGSAEIPFTEEELETVPEEALVLSGLAVIHAVESSAPVVSTPFNNSGYRNTFDAIQNDLIDIYGGYISVRYEQDLRYIDYTKDPPNSSGSDRIISFGVNLQEVSKEISAEDLYSVLLPVGDSNLLLKSASKNKTISHETGMFMLPLNGLKRYGPIFKTQSFSGISKRNELKDYAGNYISKTWRGASESYTFKTVDMHFVDGSNPLILVGCRCRITLWPSDSPKLRTCTQVTYDLQAPENNEHVFEDLPYEREGLTSKYKKQSSGGGRTSAVSTAATTEEEGSGSEDTIIRSNGNIILYPGDNKMVSIPLAKTFLAPSLTEWSLGPVKYKNDSGFEVGGNASFDNNVRISGGLGVGVSKYNASAMSKIGYGNIYALTSIMTDGYFKGNSILIGTSTPAYSNNSSQYIIGRRIGSTAGMNISNNFMPVKLSLTGGTDSSGNPISLVDMWVLGDKDVNFNIAESQWFKDQVGSANGDDIAIESYRFLDPGTVLDANKDHGKRVTLQGYVFLGLRIMDLDNDEYVIERLKNKDGTEKSELYFGPGDVTDVYNAGFDDAVASFDIRPHTSWVYDDTLGHYTLQVDGEWKIKATDSGSFGRKSDYVQIPTIDTIVTMPQKRNTWWQTSGTNAYKYVIPANSVRAKGFIHGTDQSDDDLAVSISGNSQAYVLDPSEAISHGRSTVDLYDSKWEFGTPNKITGTAESDQELHQVRYTIGVNLKDIRLGHITGISGNDAVYEMDKYYDRIATNLDITQVYNDGWSDGNNTGTSSSGGIESLGEWQWVNENGSYRFIRTIAAKNGESGKIYLPNLRAVVNGPEYLSATSKIRFVTDVEGFDSGNQYHQIAQLEKTYDVIVSDVTINVGNYENGKYDITGSGGSVTIKSQIRRNGVLETVDQIIPVNVNGTSLTPSDAVSAGTSDLYDAIDLRINEPTAVWDPDAHRYVMTASAAAYKSSAANADLISYGSETAILKADKAIEYGKTLVETSVNVNIDSLGVTKKTDVEGTYSKWDTTESNPVLLTKKYALVEASYGGAVQKSIKIDAAGLIQSVSVGKPTCGNDSKPQLSQTDPTDIRESFSIKAVASNGNKETQNFHLNKVTIGDKHFVDLLEGRLGDKMTIGRISIEDIYESGARSVKPTSARVIVTRANPATGEAAATLSISYSGSDTPEDLEIDVSDVYKKGLVATEPVDSYPVAVVVAIANKDGSISNTHLMSVDMKDVYNYSIETAPTPTEEGLYAVSDSGDLVPVYKEWKSDLISMVATSNTLKLYPDTNIDDGDFQVTGEKTMKGLTSGTPGTKFIEFRYKGQTFYIRAASCSETKKNNSQYGNKTGFYNDPGTVEPSFNYTFQSWVSSKALAAGTTTVNLRDSEGGNVIMRVPVEVEIWCAYNPIGYKNEWMPVQYGTTTGYMQSMYVVGTVEYYKIANTWDDNTYTKKGTIKTRTGIYTEKSESSEVIETVNPDTIVYCRVDPSTYKEGNTWIEVMTLSKNVGYIQVKYLNEFGGSGTSSKTYPVRAIFDKSAYPNISEFTIQLSMDGRSSFSLTCTGMNSYLYSNVGTTGTSDTDVTAIRSVTYTTYSNAALDAYNRIEVKLIYDSGRVIKTNASKNNPFS